MPAPEQNPSHPTLIERAVSLPAARYRCHKETLKHMVRIVSEELPTSVRVALAAHEKALEAIIAAKAAIRTTAEFVLPAALIAGGVALFITKRKASVGMQAAAIALATVLAESPKGKSAAQPDVQPTLLDALNEHLPRPISSDAEPAGLYTRDVFGLLPEPNPVPQVFGAQQETVLRLFRLPPGRSVADPHVAIVLQQLQHRFTRGDDPQLNQDVALLEQALDAGPVARIFGKNSLRQIAQWIIQRGMEHIPMDSPLYRITLVDLTDRWLEELKRKQFPTRKKSPRIVAPASKRNSDMPEQALLHALRKNNLAGDHMVRSVAEALLDGNPDEMQRLDLTVQLLRLVEPDAENQEERARQLLQADLRPVLKELLRKKPQMRISVPTRMYPSKEDRNSEPPALDMDHFKAKVHRAMADRGLNWPVTENAMLLLHEKFLETRELSRRQDFMLRRAMELPRRLDQDKWVQHLFAQFIRDNLVDLQALDPALKHLKSYHADTYAEIFAVTGGDGLEQLVHSIAAQTPGKEHLHRFKLREMPLLDIQPNNHYVGKVI
jgi:hypothetical protein